MAVSTIGVADAGTPDKYLHTWQRTIGGTAREDSFIQQGWSGYPTYTARADGVAGTAAATHVLQVMGDGSNYTRIVRVRIVANSASSATQELFQVVRVSSAGTGGGSITPAPFDTADTYAGGAMSAPTSKGTEAAIVLSAGLLYPTSTGQQMAYEWRHTPGSKPIVLGTSTADGVVVKAVNGVAGSSVSACIEFVVTPYL